MPQPEIPTQGIPAMDITTPPRSQYHSSRAEDNAVITATASESTGGIIISIAVSLRAEVLEDFRVVGRTTD